MVVEPLDMGTARAFVRTHHYARTTPSTTRCAYGLYDCRGNLGGVAIWGVGVRPKHTIAKWFPGVDTKDYLELNRLCLLDEWPRNSESQFLKIVAAHIKKDAPNVKLLISWADGLRGKPGYVYQGANWLYGGHISSDFYTDQAGYVLHPRFLITRYGSRGKETVRRLNLRHYYGKQFMYAKFLCPRPERETLLKQSPFTWGQGYPKAADATLTVDNGDGVRRDCMTFPTLLGRADNYTFNNADE